MTPSRCGAGDGAAVISWITRGGREGTARETVVPRATYRKCRSVFTLVLIIFSSTVCLCVVELPPAY